MPVCPIRALMEGAVQKPVKATNVNVRQAGAAPPAPPVRLHSTSNPLNVSALIEKSHVE